ncbi:MULTISPECIES: hypothetical protein [Streptomyces]|uniref:Uncharacterized protein n=1 Tax=Streptomyces morookaense TaxID=1970 RepID=A0A7Y7B8Y3_STRMO|nr:MULTISPECIES: hypothetical protein [Streptomyces]MCC2279067.1 hypothetical protein [Streptomyces sp. ET3-23]NVK81070.1 hypothetical protein [Streptomyces morookaense]GHF14674.1 hypothetical protein GCM10010359_14960 [Streptomyces morookaense]
MNAAGTIDRPTTHDPKKQDPTMQRPSPEPFGSEAPVRDTSGALKPRQNRNLEMQLIPEALARAHMQDRLQEAESERRAVRLVAARRMQRRAERASLRARRALAMAVMN